MEFEGAPLPTAAELPLALVEGDRPRLVRAAVVHAFFAGQVITACTAMLDDPRPGGRGTALQVGHALQARAMADAVAAKILSDSKDFYGVPDPVGRHGSLAAAAVAFLAEVPSPGHAQARLALRQALAHPELAPLAWKVVVEPDAILPHLATLLITRPDLAAEAGTRFALLATDRCEEAATVVASLPEGTRRAFAAALEKHLLRIHAVKRWVHCRRILLGQ